MNLSTTKETSRKNDSLEQGNGSQPEYDSATNILPEQDNETNILPEQDNETNTKLAVDDLIDSDETVDQNKSHAMKASTTSPNIEEDSLQKMCGVCNKSFTSETSLRMHLVKAHGVKLLHQCCYN